MIIPICMYCKNDEGLNCPAYPKGVPDEIYEGRVLHFKPYKQDNDIVFEPEPGMEEEAKELFGWQPPRQS